MRGSERQVGDEGRRDLALLAALLVMLVVWAPERSLALPPEPATRADAPDESCPPFDRSQAPVRLADATPVAEPGVAPARPEPTAVAGMGGQIVSLPSAGDAGPLGPVAGEAILALPKGTSRDFELGRASRVAESYWSPVLCATVARIQGPAGASPEDLVPKAPDTAALVANDVYRTAAAEVEELTGDLVRPDPYRPLQWGLRQSGVERARSLSNGAGVRVAVLDSAPQADHRDLGPMRLTAVEGGPDPGAPGAHGTLVTGVVYAIEGNGFGIAGLTPRVELVAVPVCTPRGATASDDCSLYTLLRGLDVAWSAQAQIVNLSLVGPANELLQRGMERLDELGVLVVAAAGNEGTREPRYPAAYPSVIGVGSLGPDGRLDPRSNRGPSAEILAPGVEILSTVPGDAFAFASGTSFAAGHVTGALAVLLGVGADPVSARQALFQQAELESPLGRRTPPVVPPVCDALARLDHACP